jgi:hypothetical protein
VNSSLLKSAKETAKHATTQINFPEELAEKVRKTVRKIIPKEDLMADGYEDSPHVTLRYGLLTEDEDAT